jgi:hypothetical protein
MKWLLRFERSQGLGCYWNTKINALKGQKTRLTLFFFVTKYVLIDAGVVTMVGNNNWGGCGKWKRRYATIFRILTTK